MESSENPDPEYRESSTDATSPERMPEWDAVEGEEDGGPIAFPTGEDFTFRYPRYLQAKEPIDARSRHPRVWRHLVDTLCANADPEQSLKLFEVGAGTGGLAKTIIQTLAERTAEETSRGYASIREVTYTFVDLRPANVALAYRRLRDWLERRKGALIVDQAAPPDVASRRDSDADRADPKRPSGQLQGRISDSDLKVTIRFEVGDALDHASTSAEPYDGVIGQAVLDLMHLPTAIPTLLEALKEGGVGYFPIHFDGTTTFIPPHRDDEAVIAAYHASMDVTSAGEPAQGGSQTGRKLLQRLMSADTDATLVDAAASDWVVAPTEDGKYAAHEMYFLQCMLHFFEQSVAEQASPDATTLERWLEKRRSELAAHQLALSVHQYDALVQKL
jgi:hypothetical protein